MTQDEIWNRTPPGYAAWLDGAIAEQEGAELRFVRPEDDEPSDLPDFNSMTDEELYAIAVQDLGKESADLWLARRRANRAEKLTAESAKITK